MQAIQKFSQVDFNLSEHYSGYAYICFQQSDVPFIQSCEDENNMNESAL